MVQIEVVDTGCTRTTDAPKTGTLLATRKAE